MIVMFAGEFMKTTFQTLTFWFALTRGPPGCVLVQRFFSAPFGLIHITSLVKPFAARRSELMPKSALLLRKVPNQLRMACKNLFHKMVKSATPQRVRLQYSSLPLLKQTIFVGPGGTRKDH